MLIDTLVLYYVLYHRFDWGKIAYDNKDWKQEIRENHTQNNEKNLQEDYNDEEIQFKQKSYGTL